MNMKYSVWDTEIGNRLGRFDTEGDALGFVRTMIATYGREKLGDLSLDWRNEHGVCEEVVGDALLDRAEDAVAKPEPATVGDWSGDAGQPITAMAAKGHRGGRR